MIGVVESLKYFDQLFLEEFWKAASGVSAVNESFEVIPSQPTQKRCKDVLKTSYFWPQRRLKLVWNGSRDDLFLTPFQDVFQETS